MHRVRVGACLAYDGIRFGSAAPPVPQAAAQVVVARQQSVQHLEQVLAAGRVGMGWCVARPPGGGGRREDFLRTRIGRARGGTPTRTQSCSRIVPEKRQQSEVPGPFLGLSSKRLHTCSEETDEPWR